MHAASIGDAAAHKILNGAGSAELLIPEVAGEEMHRLAPLRVGRGFRFGMAYTVTDLKILRDYTA
jgi:acetoacetate decarboxylase